MLKNSKNQKISKPTTSVLPKIEVVGLLIFGFLEFYVGGVGDFGHVGFFDFEVVAGFEAEAFGEDVAGEDFDLGVEVFGAGVVEAAGGLDFVFDVLELVLEFFEVFVGFELGVGFGDGEYLAEGAGERIFGLGGLFDAFGAHNG